MRETPIGREVGVARLGGFEDLRASAPLLSSRAHLERVEARLGFAPEDEPLDEAVSTPERRATVDAWRRLLPDDFRPRRFVRLGGASDPRVEALRRGDCAAWAERPPSQLDWTRLGVQSQAPMLEALAAAAPEVLVVSSLATISWLERTLRGPLEMHLTSLRAIVAEFDLESHIRTRSVVLNAGRLHGAGRLALPDRLEPHEARHPASRGRWRLAWDSVLLELCEEPHGAAELRSGSESLDPTEAVLGARYELAVTSERGYFRMRTGIHVRTVGIEALEDQGGRRPVPRVIPIGSPPEDLRLEGVTLPGPWLTAALRQSFEPEDPALVAAELRGAAGTADDPDEGRSSGFFAETELGSLHGRRYERARPRAISVRVEVRGSSRAGFAERLSERVDQRLRSRSPAYAYLRGESELEAPRVRLVDPGSDRAGEQARARSLRGSVARPQIRVFDD